jgi:hypothetical protein
MGDEGYMKKHLLASKMFFKNYIKHFLLGVVK